MAEAQATPEFLQLVQEASVVHQENAQASSQEAAEANYDFEADDSLSEAEKTRKRKKRTLAAYPKWYQQLTLKWNKNGSFFVIDRSFTRNLFVIMENDENIKGRFSYNEFTHETELSKSLTVQDTFFGHGDIRNVLFSALRAYIEQAHNVSFDEKTIARTGDMVGNRHSFNPVNDYIEYGRDKWIENGRIPKIDEFFVACVGAKPTELTRLQSRIFFAEMVVKGKNPGASADFVLDLVGGQGSGKTRTLRRLGNQWYAGDVGDFTDKDNRFTMASSWLVNDDELKASLKSGLGVVKSFITETSINYRRPYDVKGEAIPKSCVLARTTNDKQYLMDKTGDRRFLPMQCFKSDKTKDISLFSDDEIAMLFGEAAEMIDGGFDYNNLPEEMNQLFEDAREDFKYVDEEENRLNKYLSTFTGDFFTITDVMTDEFNIAVGSKVGTALQRKLNLYMSNTEGWVADRPSINGRRIRGYRRLKQEPENDDDNDQI